MAQRDVVTLTTLSIEAFQNGDLDRSLLGADEAIRLDSKYPEAHSIRGIVLANQGKSDEALAALSQAVRLAPTVPRYTYNLAAHQYVRKDFRGAWKSSAEALRDDPKFAPAIRLQEWIEAQDYDHTVDFDLPRVTRVASETPTPGPGHALFFMAGMERPWKIAGWCFVALGVVTAICMLVYQPFQAPSEDAKKQVMFNLVDSPQAMVTVFLLAISGVLSLMWMLIDIVDRRARLVWLIPSIACCTCGMHALPQALYLMMHKE
jgi:tetratricopeptide (TPR) repeat protein